MKHITLFTAITLTTLVMAACAPTNTPAPVDLTAQPGLPNPASVFCQQNAGRLEIRTAADGSQAGVCIFPDASECDEWAYFRGECRPGDFLSAAAPVPTTFTPPTVAGTVPLQVLSPHGDEVVNTPQMTVSGTTTPGAVVTVNDEILVAYPDGSFLTYVTLEEGPNLIEIVASDASGNESFVSLTVTYQP